MWGVGGLIYFPPRNTDVKKVQDEVRRMVGNLAFTGLGDLAVTMRPARYLAILRDRAGMIESINQRRLDLRPRLRRPCWQGGGHPQPPERHGHVPIPQPGNPQGLPRPLRGRRTLPSPTRPWRRSRSTSRTAGWPSWRAARCSTPRPRRSAASVTAAPGKFGQRARPEASASLARRPKSRPTAPR